jgi:hypothetical protein
VTPSPSDLEVFADLDWGRGTLLVRGRVTKMAKLGAVASDGGVLSLCRTTVAVGCVEVRICRLSWGDANHLL